MGCQNGETTAIALRARPYSYKRSVQPGWQDDREWEFGRHGASVVTSPMPGERRTVAVNIAARESVAGCRVTVMFDHAALRYVKAAAGDYVTEGALFKQPKIRGNGVWLEASKLDCDGESDGTLAVLTFEVRAVKTSTLHLSRVNLVDPHGERLFPRLEDAQVVEPRK